MSRALFLLVPLLFVGGWRSFWRSGRGSRIALLGKLFVCLFLLNAAFWWAFGTWLNLTVARDNAAGSFLRSWFEEGASLVPIPLFVSLAFFGTASVFAKPFRFNPSEENLLCGGPFSRRQLVSYKIGAAFSSLVMLSLLLAPLGGAVASLLNVFVGQLMVLSLIHLVCLLAGSLGTMAGLHYVGVIRQLVITLAVVVATLAVLWLPFGGLFDNPIAVIRQAGRSSTLRAATLPLRPFAEVFTAKRFWPDLAKWSSLCLVVNGLVLAAIYAIDERLERRTDDDEATTPAEAEPPISGNAPWAFPLVAPYPGSGPIAWRQALIVIRKPQQIGSAFFLCGLGLCLLYVLIRSLTGLIFLPTLDGHRELNPPGVLGFGVLAILIAMTISAGLSFDFRGDMGQMDVLKALPISPLAVAAGQLFVPVLIASAMQCLGLAVVAIALRSIPPGLWLAAAFVPPVSVVMIAIENLPTLWFPLRQEPGEKPEPFEYLGHVMLHPFLKLVGFALAAVATLAVTVAAYFLSGQRSAVAMIAAWLTLAAGGASLVALLARTFDEFDVTRDVRA
jgi:hypothetical protein